MGQLTMSLYLHNMRERYQAASKAKKSQMLDEFCATSKQHRKSAIRSLNAIPKPGYTKKLGRKKVYAAEALLEPLKNIWLATDQMCGQRLKRAIPQWLPFDKATFVL